MLYNNIVIVKGENMIYIKKGWYELLKPDLESSWFKEFNNWLNLEYQTKVIYPKTENIFNSINLVSYENVKVVIIGQDPYHEPNQAHGLSFSVEGDTLVPPSLNNIFKELKSDLKLEIPNNGNLTKWAMQGVLMLNSVLTVEKGKANSHKGKGWEKITSKIISLLNERKKPVIFLLWGASAREIGKNIDKNTHYVLTSSHPSPMSANQGGWFGNKHFSKANEILKKLGESEIDWQIENK